MEVQKSTANVTTQAEAVVREKPETRNVEVQKSTANATTQADAVTTTEIETAIRSTENKVTTPRDATATPTATVATTHAAAAITANFNCGSSKIDDCNSGCVDTHCNNRYSDTSSHCCYSDAYGISMTLPASSPTAAEVTATTATPAATADTAGTSAAVTSAAMPEIGAKAPHVCRRAVTNGGKTRNNREKS